MSLKLVALVYFYLISAAALALLIVGIFSIVQLTLNLTQYDTYPLPYYGEDCESPFGVYGKGPYPASEIAPTGIATPSSQEIERQKIACRTRVESERKRLKLNDIKDAIVYPLIGIILFAIHFPIARRYSR